MQNTVRHDKIDKRPQPLARAFRLTLICISLYFGLAAASQAASPPSNPSVTLSWPSSISTNVVGYKIHYGTNSHNYAEVLSVGRVTQATITGLTPGTTYFLAATAYDDAGLESDYSVEAVCVVPSPRPGASQPELSLFRMGTTVVLQWSTDYPGCTLQWSSSLAGEWTDLTSNPAISGTSYVYQDAAGALARFYRLKQ